MTEHCGTCKHWHGKGKNPMNLAAAEAGECRGAPPQAQLMPQPGGVVQKICFYPELPANFPACGQHAAKVVTT